MHVNGQPPSMAARAVSSDRTLGDRDASTSQQSQPVHQQSWRFPPNVHHDTALQPAPITDSAMSTATTHVERSFTAPVPPRLTNLPANSADVSGPPPSPLLQRIGDAMGSIIAQWSGRRTHGDVANDAEASAGPPSSSDARDSTPGGSCELATTTVLENKGASGGSSNPREREASSSVHLGEDTLPSLSA